MRFFAPIIALFALTAIAAPFPSTDASQAPQYSSKQVVEAIPKLQQLLQAHPEVEADIALHNPGFASNDNPNVIDYGKVLIAANYLDNPDYAGMLTTALGSFLGYLPGAIGGGISSILSGEYALISSIFKILCLGFCS
jgi:hypothetical protein